MGVSEAPDAGPLTADVGVADGVADDMADDVPDDMAGDGDVVELAARMRLAIGRLHRRFSRRAVAGLTPSQLSVLVTVEQHGPLRLGDLATREVITPPTVTRLVASLHERELVERVTDPEDGRAALVEVSRSGRVLLEEIRRERTAFIAQRIARLDPQGRVQAAAAVELLEQLIAPGES